MNASRLKAGTAITMALACLALTLPIHAASAAGKAEYPRVQSKPVPVKVTAQDAWNDPVANKAPNQERAGYSRIEFNPVKIPTLRLREGINTALRFPGDETIEDVYTSDPTYFDAVVPRANVMLVRVIKPGGDANIVVLGSSGRLYQFYVRGETAGAKMITDILVDVVMPGTPRPSIVEPMPPMNLNAMPAFRPTPEPAPFMRTTQPPIVQVQGVPAAVATAQPRPVVVPPVVAPPKVVVAAPVTPPQTTTTTVQVRTTSVPTKAPVVTTTINDGAKTVVTPSTALGAKTAVTPATSLASKTTTVTQTSTVTPAAVRTPAADPQAGRVDVVVTTKVEPTRRLVTPELAVDTEWLRGIGYRPDMVQRDLNVYLPGDATAGPIPERVVHDSRYTYISYGEKADAFREWPIASIIVNGVEMPANVRTSGPKGRVLVVEGVGDIVLRGSGKMITIRKAPGYQVAGQGPKTQSLK